MAVSVDSELSVVYNSHMKTLIKTNKNITTTLPEVMLRELDEAAKELGTQKNDILASAFTLWNKKRKQELLAESYKKMAGNKDLIALADEGLEGWVESGQL